MTRDYGKVRTVFWSDDKVSAWPERSKFLALYLLTSPHANAIGCFRLPLAYISADTGLSQKEAKDTLDNLAKENFISWCPKTNYIFIHKYLDHNKIENAKVALHCIRLTNEIPLTVPFLKGFADRFNSALSACNATNMPAWKGFAYPIDTLSKPIRYPEPEPEPEPEPKPEPEKEQSSASRAISSPSESPHDLMKELWKRGTAYLVSLGLQNKDARSLLGKWRKTHEPLEVLNALAAAEGANVSDPVSYITAVLNKKGLKNGAKQKLSEHPLGIFGQIADELQETRREARKADIT